MSRSVTTTAGMTKNVENITHTPRRLQSQIEEEIRHEQLERGEMLHPEKTIETPVSYAGSVPHYVTKEKAIHYYEQNAVGEMAELYLRTAMWLRESLSNKKDYGEVLKAVKEKDTSSSNADDIDTEE